MSDIVWQITKDELGDDVYTWGEYVVQKVNERRVTSASYINPSQPTYARERRWKAFYSGRQWTLAHR